MCDINDVGNFDDFLYEIEHTALLNPEKYLFYSQNNTKLIIKINGLESYWEVLYPEHYPNYKFRHRLNGPAITSSNYGDNEWWIKGERLSPEKEHLMNIWWSKNGK